MLLEKIVSGIKELLAPQTLGRMTKVDLVQWPGREVELITKDGSLWRIVISDSVRPVGELFVDNVEIDRASTGLRPVIMNRHIALGESPIYSESVGEGREDDRFRRYDPIMDITQITFRYPT